MSELKRFTALIGFLEKPTIDRRVWRPRGDKVELRADQVPLQTLPSIPVQPNTTYRMGQLLTETHDPGRLVGHIDGVTVDGVGAVRATGEAEPKIADALNEGRSMLLADMAPVERISVQSGLVVFLQVVLAGARVGPPSSFAWKERR